MTGSEAGRTLAAIRWSKPLPEPASDGLGPLGVTVVAAAALVVGAAATWASMRRRPVAVVIDPEGGSSPSDGPASASGEEQVDLSAR